MFGFHEKAQRKLKDRLVDAIFYNRAAEVKRLLDDGVDPNALLTDRERSLDLAMRYAQLDVINILLDAGADVREPFSWGGSEYRFSEAARLCNRPEAIVQRFERAERESAAKEGPLPPLRRRSNVCPLPAFIP